MSPIRVMSQGRRERGFVTHMVMFVVVSVLTGALVAGLIIPFAGLFGLTTQKATDAFQNMPSELEEPPLPERSRMLAADGSVIAGTEGIILSGRLPVWAFAALTHLFHPRPWVATFDPRLGGGVVIASHVSDVSVGQVVSPTETTVTVEF